MNRLSLVLLGLFLLIGGLLLLWWLSPSAHGVQRQLGFDFATATPRDLRLVLDVLLGAGIICLGGFLVQRLAGGVLGVVINARESVREATGPMLRWGVALYLLIAVLFGAFVLVIEEGTGAFDRFLDPGFLAAVLTWPYQLVAAAGLFGLPGDAF